MNTIIGPCITIVCQKSSNIEIKFSILDKEETSSTASPESKVTLPPEGGNSASPTTKAPKTNGDMEGNGEEGGNSASSTTETPQTKGDMEASGNGEEGGIKTLTAGVTTSTPRTSTLGTQQGTYN